MFFNKIKQVSISMDVVQPYWRVFIKTSTNFMSKNACWRI